MIEVYAFATPNSVKVCIALEELGLEYALRPVNIRAGAQKDPAFLARNANAKVPVLVDTNVTGAPLMLSESAAILVYLAEKTGKLLPRSGEGRARVFEQLFFHASGLGVAFGNAGYFRKLAPEQIPLAIDRFGNEALRILGVLDQTLAKTSFVAGASMTIADIAHFGWLWRREFAGIDLGNVPNVARWYAELESRPAFRRGIARTSALAQA
jgi:glutathione S-transferase